MDARGLVLKPRTHARIQSDSRRALVPVPIANKKRCRGGTMCDAPRSPPTQQVPTAKAAQRFLCGGRGASRAGLRPEARRPTRGRWKELATDRPGRKHRPGRA